MPFRGDPANELTHHLPRLAAAFMDHSPAMTYIQDEAGRLVYANRKFEHVMRRPMHEMRGKLAAELWPGTVGEAIDAHTQVVLRSRRPQETDLELGSIAGEPRRWHALTFLMADAAGTPFLGTVAFDLAERARPGETELLEARAQESEKLAAVARLAGGVAHDFNNHLTVILGYTQLIQQALPAGGQEQADLEEVRTAAERGAALTRQLLAFSRRQALQPRVLDLNQALGDMDGSLRDLAGDRIELEVVARAGIGLVNVDPVQMEQALMQLVVNARDAMPEGGRLRVETAEIELCPDDCRSRPDVAPGHYVTLTVTDQGCGIDPDIRRFIFEPFFTTKTGSGVGLGLSMVLGIVGQNGGHLDVKSEPGRGSAFCILLPKVVAADGEMEEPAAA